MNIFGKIKQAKQNAKESDLSRYFGLLATVNVDDPTEQEQAELAVLLSRLGKTPGDAENDRKAILHVQSLIGAVKATAGAAGRLQKSYADHQAALAERQRVYQEQNQRCGAAGAIHAQNTADADHCQNSKHALVKIRDADPTMFAAVAGDFKI